MPRPRETPRLANIDQVMGGQQGMGVWRYKMWCLLFDWEIEQLIQE